MEGLTRLVAESMARHGMDAPVDHRRLQWSRWFRCESGFDLLDAPSKPGLFAVAEELAAPGEIPVAGGRRMLAVLQVSQADDLGMALARLFAPSSQLKERIAGGRVFARYTVIEEDAQRFSAHSALEHWLASSAEAASGVLAENTEPIATSSPSAAEAPAQKEVMQSPSSLPSGF
jgi:hypothetical protein